MSISLPIQDHPHRCAPLADPVDGPDVQEAAVRGAVKGEQVKRRRGPRCQPAQDPSGPPLHLPGPADRVREGRRGGHLGPARTGRRRGRREGSTKGGGPVGIGVGAPARHPRISIHPIPMTQRHIRRIATPGLVGSIERRKDRMESTLCDDGIPRSGLDPLPRRRASRAIYRPPRTRRGIPSPLAGRPPHSNLRACPQTRSPLRSPFRS